MDGPDDVAGQIVPVHVDVLVRTEPGRGELDRIARFGRLCTELDLRRATRNDRGCTRNVAVPVTPGGICFICLS